MLSFQQITTVTYTQNPCDNLSCPAIQGTRNAVDHPDLHRYWLTSQLNADQPAVSCSQTEFVIVEFCLPQQGPKECKYVGFSFTYTLISLLYYSLIFGPSTQFGQCTEKLLEGQTEQSIMLCFFTYPALLIMHPSNRSIFRSV